MASIAVLGVGLLLCGCGEPPEAREPAGVSRGEPIAFLYRGNGDVVFSSKSTRGRATAVALVTTYDMGSQLLLRRVQEAVRAHRPRANAGAVVMEPPKYEILLETYAEAMSLSFPVVLADLATREGRGPFGPVDYLPALFVLDQEGRLVANFQGPVELDSILEALEEASPSGRGD